MPFPLKKLIRRVSRFTYMPSHSPEAAATASACILVRGRDCERAADVVAVEPVLLLLLPLLFELLTRVREGTDLTLTWPLSFSTGTLPHDAACFLALMAFSLSP